MSSNLTLVEYFAPGPMCNRQSCSRMQEYLPIGRLNALESVGMDALKAELHTSIKKGVDFVHQGVCCSLPTFCCKLCYD